MHIDQDRTGGARTVKDPGSQLRTTQGKRMYPAPRRLCTKNFADVVSELHYRLVFVGESGIALEFADYADGSPAVRTS